MSQDSHNNGDYANVKARKDWVGIFLGQERFPVELGWKRHSVMPAAADLTGITAVITTARNNAAALSC